MTTLRELKSLLPEGAAGVVNNGTENGYPADPAVGITLLCSTPAGGNQPRPAEIIEVRKIREPETEIEMMRYYVHFINSDKRLDEWVSPQLLPVEYCGAPSTCELCVRACRPFTLQLCPRTYLSNHHQLMHCTAHSTAGLIGEAAGVQRESRSHKHRGNYQDGCFAEPS